MMLWGWSFHDAKHLGLVEAVVVANPVASAATLGSSLPWTVSDVSDTCRSPHGIINVCVIYDASKLVSDFDRGDNTV